MIKETTMLKQCATRVCNIHKFPFAGTDLIHIDFNLTVYSFFSEAGGDLKENITKNDPQSSNLSVDINSITETELTTESNNCAKNHQGPKSYVLNLNTLETRF